MALWDKIESTSSVDDRRGSTPVLMGGSVGIVGVIVFLLYAFLGGSGSGTDGMQQVLEQLQQTSVSQQTTTEFDGQDNYEVFTSKVVGSSNDVWRQVLQREGGSYSEPRLVLFRQATQSGCGVATAAVGPHYCPLDQTIYLDETFFDVLTTQFGARGGDVAQAYVIAHEVAHHAQNELGIMEQVQMAQRQYPDSANDLSVRLELQADCFAGVWAYSVSKQGVLEPGEVNEALDAAAAVGDDRVQASTEGQANQESWTHGSSEQRTEWFNRGYVNGQPSLCDTFAGSR